MTNAVQPLRWQEVSRALFETDPMHTACRENDCFDEYDRVARDVVAEIDDGATVRVALQRALVTWFGAELLESRDLGPAVERLNAHADEGGSR